MAFLESIRTDIGPITVAAAMILIIVGLTIMAMGYVLGYLFLGIGIIAIAARVVGLV